MILSVIRHLFIVFLEVISHHFIHLYREDARTKLMNDTETIQIALMKRIMIMMMMMMMVVIMMMMTADRMLI